MFDPFCDFEERGYLRNKFGEKNPDIIRHLEHSSFIAGLDAALLYLSARDFITYDDVLETHKILFEDVYPWAGQDRSQTAPDIAVGKGDVLFAHPEDTRNAVDYALRVGQDKNLMVSRVGEVMGCLAYGHPFLDGNGRTIMVIHAELAERAGIGINWAAANKGDYLTVLTQEIKSPGKGYLDKYLSQYVARPIGRDQLVGHLGAIQGLRGVEDVENKIEGKITDPVVQERYRQMKKQPRGWQGLSKG